MDYEELKAENERLKKENEILLCQLVINDGEDVTVQISESQFDKYNKYKQTLQEIKEIAEKIMADNLCNNCDGIGLDANCQDTGCPVYQMDKILQKIAECEVSE